MLTVRITQGPGRGAGCCPAPWSRRSSRIHCGGWKGSA